mgnify:FL=1
MTNKSEVFEYNVSGAGDSFPGLARTATEMTGGALPYTGIFLVWLISFFALSQFPNPDTLKASTFTAWLTSGFFAVMELIEPSFVVFMSLVLVATAAYDYQSGIR